MNNFHNDVVSAISDIEQRRWTDQENLRELCNYLDTGTGRGGGVGVNRSDDHLTITFHGRPLVNVSIEDGQWTIYGAAGVDSQRIADAAAAKKSIASIVARAIDAERQGTRRS
jgi:hypothetical protein